MIKVTREEKMTPNELIEYSIDAMLFGEPQNEKEFNERMAQVRARVANIRAVERVRDTPEPEQDDGIRWTYGVWDPRLEAWERNPDIPKPEREEVDEIYKRTYIDDGVRTHNAKLLDKTRSDLEDFRDRAPMEFSAVRWLMDDIDHESDSMADYIASCVQECEMHLSTPSLYDEREWSFQKYDEPFPYFATARRVILDEDNGFIDAGWHRYYISDIMSVAREETVSYELGVQATHVIYCVRLRKGATDGMEE